MAEITVGLTGATGNMGRETLRQLVEIDGVKTVRALILPSERRIGEKFKKLYGSRLEVVYGDISDKSVCRVFVRGVDLVMNLAAVIPPKSDHDQRAAERCNLAGVKNLVDSIGESEPSAKLVHISTVALYGNRNDRHPWGRVGDPLLPSVYDCYATTKLAGERYVVESPIQWAVLRQTAMLHERMLADNMRDGLMFHTCHNAPLEWVTAGDSGRLMAKIAKSEIDGDLDRGFWRNCYNIGGGERNRCTGYEIFDAGFKLIGGDAQKFLKPHWNAIRNFHGVWFYDGDRLNETFDYQKEDIDDYWAEIGAKHPVYRIAKILPPALISKLAIQRLLNDENAPARWAKNGDAGKITAYFGDEKNYASLPKNWKNFPLLSIFPDGGLRELKDPKNARLLSHGFDDVKPAEKLALGDARDAARFRGGRLVSENMKEGDLYTKLEWECQDGHRFSATPFSVLKAGHWCPRCAAVDSWDFDRLAENNPFYAQVWYDSHGRDEKIKYYFDKDFNARFERYGD